MKLITFQSYEALKFLINNGFLATDEKYINMEKAGIVYDWVIEKMNQYVPCTDKNIKYPVWAWVKCHNGICPPKHKGSKVKSFNVKITFNKDEKDVFVTDFEKFSFVINNVFIPENLKEKQEFEKLLADNNITYEDLKAFVRKDKYTECRNDETFLNVCEYIRSSFDRVISSNGSILQGCVWKISIDEIESIEFLPDDEYVYGSLNYVRKNGKRFDWIENHYKKLK